jgi:hypothetical protein
MQTPRAGVAETEPMGYWGRVDTGATITQPVPRKPHRTHPRASFGY